MANILKPEANWKQWQKILFRYFFVLLSLLSLIAYNPIIQIFNISWKDQTSFFGHLQSYVVWLDNHIYHLGYLPHVHSLEFSDTRFGAIITLTILIISVLVTMLWTFFDKASNYNRLYFWFCNYLAYYIFLAMARYAIYKVIPIQAHYPNAADLMSRLGSFQKWELLFLFMGASPAYCMFCGWLELIASTLLLFNRTRVLGGLLMIIVLIQVVCFNIFYNINVKLLASILLLSTLFIMARSLPKLYKILVKLQPVSLAEYKYGFTTPWKKYAILLLCLLPVLRIYNTTVKAWKYYSGLKHNEQKQRLYTVTKFSMQNDTLPSLTMDTIRWKYVVFFYRSPSSQTLIKYDMQEKTKNYRYSFDTAKRTLALVSEKDTLHKNVFAYARSINGDIELKGIWYGKRIAMELKNMPIDSMTLVKDKFLLMQGDQ